MPKKIGIYYRELLGKLRMLRVVCDKCGRADQYSVERLAREDPEGTVLELREKLSRDCPKRKSIDIYDRCGIHCPDLPKVV